VGYPVVFADLQQPQLGGRQGAVGCWLHAPLPSQNLFLFAYYTDLSLIYH
jgi:hypothetical protein